MFEMNKDYVFKKDLYWEDMSRFFVKAADWSEEVDGMPVTRIRDFTNRDMEYVDIPDSVTIIGEMAFSGCTSLKEITIPGTSGVIYVNQKVLDSAKQ